MVNMEQEITQKQQSPKGAKRIKADFRLVGLSAGNRFTVSVNLHDDAEIFWAESALPTDRYKALFAWAKSADDFWKTKWIVEIEHDGLFRDGTPKNPLGVAVREWDL